MPSRQPNILLLMTDQQRYDSLGCTGCPAANTPNLDRLAAQGVLFEHSYVNNPICTPSRASLMTGKSLPGHGVYRLYDDLPDDEVMFPERLRDLGYQTALFGKLHVSSKDFECHRRNAHDGFEIYEWCMEGGLGMGTPMQAYAKWLAENHPEFHDRLKREFRKILHHPSHCHFTHWTVERAIDYLHNRRDGRPFFCMVSIFDPHNPYEDYPPEAGDLIDESRIREPLIREDEFVGKPTDLLREHRSSYMGDFAKYSREDLRRMRFGYHASIAFADREFGRVLQTLDELELTENTLVIFTSDHGDMLGDHQLLVKGAFFYDPNTRVPLILRWPDGLQTGLRTDALVQNHDLAATILAAAGTRPENLAEWMPEAQSLLSVGRGEAESVHREAICCYRNSGISGEPSRTPYFDPPINATMLRDERYKLNVWHDNGTGRPVEGELYDMETDPLEERSLWDSPDHAAIRLRLTERLMEWLASHERRHGKRSVDHRPGAMLNNQPK
jgi:arylsulfatase A-like enzyme